MVNLNIVESPGLLIKKMHIPGFMLNPLGQSLSGWSLENHILIRCQSESDVDSSLKHSLCESLVDTACKFRNIASLD